MNAKYRVDFYYWNKDTGFSHVETVDNNLEYFDNAKEYIEDIENTAEWIGLNSEGYGMPITDYDAIWVKIVDNENDYVLSEYWWELTKNNNKTNHEDSKNNHNENQCVKHCLEETKIWIYQIQAEDGGRGDGGVIIAETEEEALNELKNFYGNDNINERINPDCEKYTWGLNILPLNCCYSEGNVYITHPY